MWTARWPSGKCEKEWSSCASSADGLKVIACSDRIYVSHDGGETWATTPLVSAGKCSASSADGLKLIVGGGRLYVSANGGTTWTETQPEGDVTGQWTGCDITSDGTKMIACNRSHRAHLSMDGGTSWAEVQPAGDVDAEWWGCSCSADGAIMLFWGEVTYAISDFFLSQDSGLTWGKKTIRNIVFCASSMDGQKMIVGENLGRIYISANGGDGWSETQPKGNVNSEWACCDISADGLKAIVSENPGRLYISSDGGVTWAETRPVGDVDGSWTGCALSPDGTKAIVTNKSLRAYHSIDGGTTWTETQPKGDLNGEWTGCALNSDGLKGIIGEDPGRLYLTSDGGDTWNETQPLGNVDENWSCYALSSDGLKVVVAADYGCLHVSSDGGDTWIELSGSRHWTGLAITPDGTKGIAGSNNSRLYISVDGGENWTETRPEGEANEDWSCCALSADGLKMISGENPGRLYVSVNGGNTWIRKTLYNINFCNVNAEGTKIIVGEETGYDEDRDTWLGGRAYMSSDGDTWQEIQPVGDIVDHYDLSNWDFCTFSSDGQRILICGRGRIYISVDGGLTWTEREIAGPVGRAWAGCDCSMDGMTLIISEGYPGGWVWTSIDGGECADLSTPHRPLVGGISGHANEEDCYGTLGMIVRDKRDRKLVMLTNNHCAGTLYDGNYEIPDTGSLYTTGIEMMQPSPGDGGIAKDVFGQVKRAVSIQFGLSADQDNHVDAAIVSTEINDANIPINFLDNGPFTFLPKSAIHMLPGEGVFVVGRTEGLITAVQAVVEDRHYGVTITYTGGDGNHNKAIFTDQILIRDYDDMVARFKPGSSGSMVLVRRGDVYCVIGILFAGGPGAYNAHWARGMVCPIEDVAELLEIEPWDGSIVVPTNLDTHVEIQDRTYTRVGGTPDEVTHTIDG